MQIGDEKPFPFHSNLSAEQFYSKARRKPQSQLNQIIKFNQKINTQPSTDDKEFDNMMEVNNLLNEEKISFKIIKKQYSIISAGIHFMFSLMGRYHVLDFIFLFMFIQTAIILMNIVHYYEFSENKHRIKLIYVHMIVFVLNIIGMVHIPESILDGFIGIMIILVDLLMIRELWKILGFMKKIQEEKKQKNKQLEDDFDEFDDF